VIENELLLLAYLSDFSRFVVDQRFGAGLRKLMQPPSTCAAIHCYMKFFARYILTAALLTTISSGAEEDGQPRNKADIEVATRLQVFLDRAEFAPGKIDGRYGEFTVKALALYREAHGENPAALTAKYEPNHVGAPDVTGLDLASIEPISINYTVTETDLQAVGKVPTSIPEQAKEKSLPYQDAAETSVENFHTDADLLTALEKLGH